MTIDQAFIDMINRNNFVVLDVETTGKEHYDVICEIAILDADAKVLLHTKVNPLRPISPEASRIHGITDDDVANAPTWLQLWVDVERHLNGKDIVVWNEKHERMLFHRSDETAGLRHYEWKNCGRWHDAMVFYAELYGEPNQRYANAKWQSLTNAVKQQGIEPGLFHSALGDTFMTLSLCKHIALNPAQVKVFQKPQVEHDVNTTFLQGINVLLCDTHDHEVLNNYLKTGWKYLGATDTRRDPDSGEVLFPQVILFKKL